MYKYKNITDQEQALTGFGLIKPDQEFTTTRPVENPNFELIEATETDRRAINDVPAKPVELNNKENEETN